MNTEISAKGSQLHREQHPLQAYRTTCHPANNLENTGPRDVVYSMIKGSESGNMRVEATWKCSIFHDVDTHAVNGEGIHDDTLMKA